MKRLYYLYPIYLLALLVIVAMVATMPSCSKAPKHSADIAQLLTQLDEAIDNRAVYFERKEHVIDSLRTLYNNAATDAERFDALGHMYDEYRSYNADSALVMCQRRVALAEATGNQDYILHAALNMADRFMYTNMYAEALEIVTPLSSSDVPDYLRSYLFHIKRTTYGLLADNAVVPEIQEHYLQLTETYRDSILSVNQPDGLTWHIVRADQLNSHGKPQEAINLIDNYKESGKFDSEHEIAILAYTLADSYNLVGDTINEEKMLIKSAICDMVSPVREYISLRRLAIMLYNEGDVDHAYKYLHICMDDARECNARQRILELHDIYPVVNDMYLKTIDNQQRRLRTTLIIVGVLAIFLLVSLIAIRKQNKRVTAAHNRERQMSAQLKALNTELQSYNERLLEANRAIAENSSIKEEYIARYMDLCLVYIDKLDTYRKTLHKLAVAGRIEDLKTQTKSVTFIDGELNNFYDNFDETFLRLFPTFIADFNSLLRPDEQIVPKQEGRLNTELRIFALIRLGINDSVKIAKFLRYSLTTIYNYRTRIRNRAAGDRDLLEQEMMNIGRSTPLT